MTTVSTSKITLTRLFLHLEGFAVFIAAIVLYAHLRGDALVFILLLLVPDVSMLGYLVNLRIGSLLYNIVHIYTTPLIFGGLMLLLGWQPGAMLAIIWLAHIGMDRTAGYGLKYADEPFAYTHLKRV